MNSTDLDRLQLFRGKSLILEDVCLVYFPTQGDIADIGYNTFYNYIGALTMDKSELFENKEEGNEIIYLIAMAQLNEEFYKMIKEAFYFFIKEEITILPDVAGIQIGDIAERRVLYQENFLTFQSYIKIVCALGMNEDIAKEENEHLRQIKEKIRKGQALVAKIKAKQGEGDDQLDLVDLISSYLAKAQEVNIHTIWDMPYYMFQIQFRRMQMIEEYDMNIRSAMAGAKIPKEKMKHWIRKIQ